MENTTIATENGSVLYLYRTPYPTSPISVLMKIDLRGGIFVMEAS